MKITDQEAGERYLLSLLDGTREVSGPEGTAIIGLACLLQRTIAVHECVLATDVFRDVQKFHEHFEIGYDGPPRQLLPDLETFRTKFVTEEYKEFMDAIYDEDRIDAICDLIYVLVGYAYLRGWPLDEAWRRVHAANMKKVLSSAKHKSVREHTHSTDIVKPPGWSPPDHSDLVAIPKVAQAVVEPNIAPAGAGDREVGK